MEPFSITEAGMKLRGQYLQPQDLAGAVSGLTHFEREELISQWLSEGIPYAFKDSPLLFEAVRFWLAARLGVQPKCVTLVGSGRVGYSLAPFPRYGQPFGHESDLDLTIVSEKLFVGLKSAFERWRADVVNDAIRPRNEVEERYWADNLARLPGNIDRGFIDSYKIPNMPEYADAQRLNNLLSIAFRKLQTTPGAPQIKRVSARVFRDWRSFLRQGVKNLVHSMESLVNRPI